MFDVVKFYDDAQKGLNVDEERFFQYIRSFSKVILWGCGNLGSKLGEYFQRRGIQVDCYWDMRWKTLGACNGIQVKEPFSESDSFSESLVIVCITNAFIVPDIIKELKRKDIAHLNGLNIYQAMLCPNNIRSFDIQECNRRPECNVAICKRMSYCLKEAHRDSGDLFLQTVDIYTTQNCSLGCKYCYIYENSYPLSKRINFPTDRILKDIDSISSAASYIKRMVAFGGEPFLHPDIDVIVERMASKKNIGVVNIISNGIFRVGKEKLSKLNHPNVRIDISNYTMTLEERLVEIWKKNCELLKSLGLNVTIHTETPQWRKPGRLVANHLNENQLIEKKSQCPNFNKSKASDFESDQTLIVKNGKLYACQHCDTVHNLGIADFEQDYVKLSEHEEKSVVLKKIRKLLSEKYYGACDYCNPPMGLVDFAGEQGVDEMYLLDKR